MGSCQEQDGGSAADYGEEPQPRRAPKIRPHVTPPLRSHNHTSLSPQPRPARPVFTRRVSLRKPGGRSGQELAGSPPDQARVAILAWITSSQPDPTSFQPQANQLSGRTIKPHHNPCPPNGGVLTQCLGLSVSASNHDASTHGDECSAPRRVPKSMSVGQSRSQSPTSG